MGKADVVIDIETVTLPVTQEDVDTYMREKYDGAPKNWKDPEKIKQHEEDARRDAIETIFNKRRFAVDGARVICVGLGTVCGAGAVAVESLFSDDETELANFIVGYLQGFSSYRLVGANILGFDIPHIARILHRANLTLPNKPGQRDFIDILKQGPLKDQKISCKRAAKAYGIKPSIAEIDGSKVGQLYEEQNTLLIEEYCKSDVILEAELFMALSRVHTF